MDLKVEKFLNRRIGEPNYTRSVFLDTENGPNTGEIKLWMPFYEKKEYWSCLSQLSWIDGGRHSISSSDDAIGSIIAAIYQIRLSIDAGNRKVFYRRQEHGGFPIWINEIFGNDLKNSVTEMIKDIEEKEFLNLKF